MREKIFVSAYACEPGLGSEIGVGWHWVLEMSKHFDLWVLTRESNRLSIEPWIAQHPEFAHIHWLYFDLPKWARFWKKGLRGVRTYYNIWQLCTNGIVKRTMQENDISLFHHLTYGNVLWKVSSYGQRQRFIWGPVGGLETIPAEYSHHYGWRSRMIECVRRWSVKMLPMNRGFYSRCRKADLILCKTEITRQLIPAKYRNKAVLFTDVAVDKTFNILPLKTEKDFTKFLVVGRLDAWRGFDLAIEAVGEAVKVNPKIHLTILGKGSDGVRLRRLVAQRGLNEWVTFAGSVPMDEYQRMMAETDCVINTSLKEGAVTVSFDSLAMGKPLICLDTTGYTRYFNNDYAVVIPRRERKRVIADITTAMLRLTDADVRKKMGEKAVNAGKAFTWQHHGAEIAKVIEERIIQHLS